MSYQRFHVPENATPIEELDRSVPDVTKFIRTTHMSQLPQTSYESFDHSTYHEPAPPKVEYYQPEYRCSGVYDHVSQCPVCRRLYMSSGNTTVYLCIIAILVITCVLLFRKAFP